jgi:hypothetical protein
MDHLAQAFADAVVRVVCWSWCVSFFAVVGGVIEGGATVLRKYRRHPSVVRRLVRRTAYVAMRRGTPLLAAIALITVCRASTATTHVGVLTLWLVSTAATMALQVQALMLLVDVSLLHLLSVRDATVGAVPLSSAPTPESVADASARWLGLTALAACPTLFHLPTPLHHFLAALVLGCSLHDAALRARGCPPTTRRRLWRREALIFTLLALSAIRVADSVMAALGESGTDLLGTLHSTIALLVALPLALAAACRPLNLAEALSTWPYCAPPGLLLTALELPLTLGPQLLNRASRVIRSGALAPNLNRAVPPPPLRLLLHVGGYLATPFVWTLLPAELTSPALQGLVAEAVAPDDLAIVLTHLSDLINIKDDRLRHTAVRRLPGLTGAAIGIPRPLIEAIGDVLASRHSVVQLQALQRALAVRMTALRAARGRAPLTATEWKALNVPWTLVQAWRLEERPLLNHGGHRDGVADPRSHMSGSTQQQLQHALTEATVGHYTFQTRQ